MTWIFETDCVSSDGESINDMKAAAKPSSYRTLRKVLGEAFIERQAELGYDTGSKRGGLRMSKDWHVAYYRSVYRGVPCYYFVWSGIEQVFVEQRIAGRLPAGPIHYTKNPLAGDWAKVACGKTHVEAGRFTSGADGVTCMECQRALVDEAPSFVMEMYPNCPVGDGWASLEEARAEAKRRVALTGRTHRILNNMRSDRFGCPTVVEEVKP